MPSINDIQADRIEAKISFQESTDSEIIGINNLCIRYIILEDLYFERSIPVIYISLTLPQDLHEKVVKAQYDASTGETNKGRFILEINKYNVYAASPMVEKCIKDKFCYLLSNQNPDYNTDVRSTSGDTLSNYTENAESYMTITAALMSVKLLNAIRSESNPAGGILLSGIFKFIDMNTLINKTFEGLDKYNLKVISKPIMYNTTIGTKNVAKTVQDMIAQAEAQGAKLTAKDKQDLMNNMTEAGTKASLIIPPMINRGQVVKFLFDRAPFYNTPFLFYMDYDNCYLLDQAKGGFEVKDGKPKTVIFTIPKATDDRAYLEGYIPEDDQLFVYINPANAKFSTDQGSDKVYNKIISTNEDSSLQHTNLGENKSKDDDDKFIYKRGGNVKLLRNIRLSNCIYLAVQKPNMDGTMLRPYKSYRVKSFDKYKQYDGDYILLSKKEIIRNSNGVFRCSTECTLKKIGEIIDIGFTDPETAAADGVYDNSKEVQQSGRHIYTSSSRHSKTSNIHKTKNKTTSKKNNQSKYRKAASSYDNREAIGEISKDQITTFDTVGVKSVEQQLEEAEERRGHVMTGAEVSVDSCGPVVVGTSKTMNIYRTDFYSDD